MFENLSDKLQRVFKNLRGEGRLTVENMEVALREIRVALLEDSLHHDRPAWPAEARAMRLRPPQDADRVRLTLPLTSEMYRDAAPADAPWTRP